LTNFYELSQSAGVRVSAAPAVESFRYLDAPDVRERLVCFSDARRTRVVFQIPSIHCVACVWLLENLFRLNPAIGRSEVNFPRKELALTFDPGKAKLSDVVALLASLGYEPELKLAALEKPAPRISRRLWLQLGIAGFAFGNTMMFSLAQYFGMDAFSGLFFQKLVGWISLALALPVVVYSAADYWRSAWLGLRQRMLTLEVPIAAGIVAIFAQSTVEVVSGRGVGYFDSLCGLLFFLLIGRVFQQKTYDRLAFDRDYKSFFPLAVTRKDGRDEERVSLSALAVGDRLVIRNGELIPADARLVSGPALLDFSFVTGESDPVAKQVGDYLYAGGRQMGGAIEVEMVKAVSQSYLTSLWNQEAFRKERGSSLNTITNRFSQRFTKIVLGIALAAAAVWLFIEPANAIPAFTSVLIVACPCALALVAPFALGTAQRVLGGDGIFLKNPQTIETLAAVNAVVFDKTGTLTATGASAVHWHGRPLNAAEEQWLFSLTRHSTHPLAVRIGEVVAGGHFPEVVTEFVEVAGCGMTGRVCGHVLRAGSAAWLESMGQAVPDVAALSGSVVHITLDGKHRGWFELGAALRPQAGQLIAHLAADCELALLSGDNAQERAKFQQLFGADARLHFNQSPLNKLEFIRELQKSGRTVMMVGDGLNDAGALRQSDVGVAVVERVSTFSPASDVILHAGAVSRAGALLDFSRHTVRVIRAGFIVSGLYNVAGIAIAAQAKLAPVVCAVLMPLSSITVVLFAAGLTAWFGRRAGFRGFSKVEVEI
jgi:Cu+-exporting ATPase